MHGKSIRAFSLAASDPSIMVAGALDGVYRSKDGGDTWERISSAAQSEIKNIESIAIDPKNPNAVYAGPGTLPGRQMTAARTGTISIRG